MFQLNAPLISIITPVYNCAAFIAETIRSVQAQTHTNWEMLIADDGSTDETAAICRHFAEDDARIQLLSLSQNGGAAKARNEAIQQAKGEYLAFLDGDDIWLPQKLEQQVQFMQTHNLSFSFTGYTIMDENGTDAGAEIQAPSIVDYHTLAGNTIIGCLTVMLNRHKIGPVEMPSIQPEDTALWLQLLRKGHTAYGLAQPLAKYRIVKGSVSRNKWRAAARYWNLLRIQEKLGVIKGSAYFLKYAWNAYQKNKY